MVWFSGIIQGNVTWRTNSGFFVRVPSTYHDTVLLFFHGNTDTLLGVGQAQTQGGLFNHPGSRLSLAERDRWEPNTDVRRLAFWEMFGDSRMLGHQISFAFPVRYSDDQEQDFAGNVAEMLINALVSQGGEDDFELINHRSIVWWYEAVLPPEYE